MSEYCVPTDACHPERPFFVATERYTAVCPDGTTGAAVTKIAQCESEVSFEHARFLAREKAKCEAEAALVCLFTANRCVIPECEPEHPGLCAEGTGLTQQLADAAALAAAQALADTFCEQPSASYVFDFGNSDNRLNFSGINIELRLSNDTPITDFDFVAGVDYETDSTLDFTAQVLANPTTVKIHFTIPSGAFGMGFTVDPVDGADGNGNGDTVTLNLPVDEVNLIVTGFVIEN